MSDTMKRALRHTLLLLLLSVVTVHAGEQPGQALYLRYCAACHGRQGRGDGPVAPALGEKPTDLTQLAATHGEEFPLQAVVDAIDGTRTVPHPKRRSRGAARSALSRTISDLCKGCLLPRTDFRPSSGGNSPSARSKRCSWSAAS